MHRNHKTAINHVLPEPADYFNYARSLQRSSLMDEGWVIARAFYDKFPRLLDAQLSLYDSLILCGRYIEANDLAVKHLEISVTREKHEHGLYKRGLLEQLPEMIDIMQSAGITDDDVSALCALYYSAISQLKVGPVVSSIYIHEGLIIKHIRVPAGLLVINDKIFAICERLAATDRYNDVVDHFAVMMTPN
ncbi:MAG: hypothetical protein ACR2P9_05680 [Gammaproteobacteria bacterium]